MIIRRMELVSIIKILAFGEGVRYFNLIFILELGRILLNFARPSALFWSRFDGVGVALVASLKRETPL